MASIVWNTVRKDMAHDTFRENGYAHREGRLMFELPDGHLKEGGSDVFTAGTGLPYCAMNFDPAVHPGTKVSDRLVEIPYPELMALGYPATEGLEVVYLEIERPQNIPQILKRTGCGITGRDLLTEKLSLDALNGRQIKFEEELLKQGIRSMGDLGYKVSHTGLLVRCDAPYVGNTGSTEDFRRYVNWVNSQGSEFKIGSEFYVGMAPHVLMSIFRPGGEVLSHEDLVRDRESGRHEFTERIAGPGGNYTYAVKVKPIQADEITLFTANVAQDDCEPAEYRVEIKWSAGQTESALASERVQALVETLETGGSVLENQFLVVGDLALRGSTPYFLVNNETYEAFRPAIDYLRKGIEQGVHAVREKSTVASHAECPDYPTYYFHDRLDADVFVPIGRRHCRSHGIPEKVMAVEDHPGYGDDRQLYLLGESATAATGKKLRHVTAAKRVLGSQ